jgi:predicted RND superfamily exporter protein
LKKFAEFVIRHRKIVILSTVIITLILGYFIKNLKIDPDIMSYLPKHDPVVRLYNRLGTEYGGNLLALVVLETDNIFQQKAIRDLSNLTSAFRLIDGVAYVTSMASTIDIKTGQDGIEIGRLIDQYELPATDKELAELKKYVMSKEMYRGRLVSEDATTTLIICRLQPHSDEIKTVKEIKRIVGANDISGKVYFGGIPFMMLDVNNMMVKDLLTLLPLVAFVIILTLLVSFRSLWRMVLPLVAVGVSAVWTLGFMCMLGIPISIVSNIIPVILFAVGSAYGIHVISRLGENRQMASRTGDPANHYEKALAAIILPVQLAAITTMVGFTSFIFGSYLTMIREFGIFATLGVLIAYIVSITFIPALASYMHHGPKPRGSKEQPRISLLQRVSKTIFRHPRVIAGVGILLVVLSALGIPRIQRKVDILDYFKPGTDVRLTEDIIREKFGGSMPIQILVKGDIADPQVLEAMRDFQIFLDSHHDVHHSQSVADLIEEMSFVIGEGRIIPDTRAKVTNLWFLLEGEEIMSQLVNMDRSEAVIQATLESSLQTDRVKVIVEDINNYIQKTSTSEYSFQQTGMPTIHYRLDQSIKRSQIQSIVIAALAIFVTLLFLLRSVYGGLIGLIPIGFSIAGIFGIMGFLRIPLDIATVLVGSISIGIGVDYSIHFLNRFKREYQLLNNIEQALEVTLQTAGRAISINVMSVALGFLVLMLANLIPLQRFGILIAVTMIASGLGALIIMPAVIIIAKPKFLTNISRKIAEGD